MVSEICGLGNTRFSHANNVLCTPLRFHAFSAFSEVIAYTYTHCTRYGIIEGTLFLVVKICSPIQAIYEGLPL